MSGPTERPKFQDCAGEARASVSSLQDADPVVVVEALNSDGRGVGRRAGKVLFVEGALPGERVRVRVLRRHKRYDTGRALEILESSPDRVVPRCRYFGICGGCSLQHLRAQAQPAAKERWLRDNLERIGRVRAGRWLPALTGNSWGYRRRARLGARYVASKGGVLVGFRERQRSLITPLGSCEVLDPELARLLPEIRELVAALSRPDRVPQIELAAGDRAVALVFRHLEPLTDADRTRLREFGGRMSVQVFSQAGGPESVVPLWPDQPPDLDYGLPGHDLDFRFGPTDFVQVNGEMNRAMVDQALALLAPQPHERVLDLYCGLGNFSLPIARHARQVLGIEGDPALVHRARENADRHGLGNAEFRAADLARPDGPDPWGPEPFDAWVLDPPRTGALAAVQRLHSETGPRRIVYVSCNPATLARDAGILVSAKGYRLEAAGILDMFPQTAHIEAMALFERTR